MVGIEKGTPIFSSIHPVAIDLFSGAGGLSLGFEQAGFDVIATVEYDPVHAATHLFNFPQCEILCRDAARLTAEDIIGTARANDLLLEYLRIVTEIRPRTFCLENVAGLLETKFEAIRGEAFKRLRKAGYALSGTEKPLNSLNFEVPQTRRRVIVLGSLDGLAPSRPVTTDGTLSAPEALKGLPAVSRYDGLLSSDEVTLSQSDEALRQETKGAYARQLAGLGPIPGDRSHPRLWTPELLTNSRRTVYESMAIKRFNKTQPGSVEPKSRLYKLPSDGPSRTLRARTGAERGAHTSPRPIHPSEDRVITVREAARLHGYPDWFRFHTTNWHGHRQVGNSVPPPLARAAAAALLLSLKRNPSVLRAAVPLGEAFLLSPSRTKAQPVVNALKEELPATRTRVTPPGPAEEKPPKTTAVRGGVDARNSHFDSWLQAQHTPSDVTIRIGFDD